MAGNYNPSREQDTYDDLLNDLADLCNIGNIGTQFIDGSLETAEGIDGVSSLHSSFVPIDSWRSEQRFFQELARGSDGVPGEGEMSKTQQDQSQLSDATAIPLSNKATGTREVTVRDELRDQLQRVREETKEALNNRKNEPQDIIQEMLRKIYKIIRSETTSVEGDNPSGTQQPGSVEHMSASEVLGGYEEAKMEIAAYMVQILNVQKANDEKVQMERDWANKDFRMPILRELTSDRDLQQALLLTENIPHMLPVSYAIKAKKRCPPGFCRLFGYPSHYPVLWFCVLPDLKDVLITVWANPLYQIGEEQLKDAFQQFNDCYKIVPGKTSLRSSNNVSDKLIEFLKQRGKITYRWKSTASHLFFMNEEQQKIVSEMQSKLPSGYRFDDVHPEVDVDFIKNKCEDKIDWSVFRVELECLPTVTVRRGDELVGIGNFGMYTFYLPLTAAIDERVKSALEMRIWQESISKKFWPLRSVCSIYKEGLRQYNESNLWTRLDDGDGNPIIMNLIHIK